jgi:hypothetical protein
MKTAAIQVQEYIEINKIKIGELAPIDWQLRNLTVDYRDVQERLKFVREHFQEKQLYSDQGIVDMTALIGAITHNIWQSILLLEILGIPTDKAWNELYLQKLTKSMTNFEQFTKTTIDTISANNPGVEF